MYGTTKLPTCTEGNVRATPLTALAAFANRPTGVTGTFRHNFSCLWPSYEENTREILLAP